VVRRAAIGDSSVRRKCRRGRYLEMTVTVDFASYLRENALPVCNMWHSGNRRISGRQHDKSYSCAVSVLIHFGAASCQAALFSWSQ
jgi:hypothetical protein